MTEAMDRQVERIVSAHQQREGAGFLVRRPVPTQGLDQVDPILMVDEVGPVDYAPGEAIGAPDHPHRGFQTVSYVLAGEKLHEDSTGKTQLIGPGDVQWMTAGAGIVHSELPSPAMRERGGRTHSFQIWVNLPARHKFETPGYQYVQRDQIPVASSPDDAIVVTVIAGEAFGVDAAVATYTPIVLQDWCVRPGGRGQAGFEPSFNLAAYVFDGEVALGPDGMSVQRGQMALLGAGTQVTVASDTGGRFLLLGGEPIDEPVARYGPFVMNTRDELVAAVGDYQSGRMGVIERA
ncbi:MAG: pirin family protein [Alphaproteobacteria bacterium]